MKHAGMGFNISTIDFMQFFCVQQRFGVLKFIFAWIICNRCFRAKVRGLGMLMFSVNMGSTNK